MSEEEEFAGLLRIAAVPLPPGRNIEPDILISCYRSQRRARLLALGSGLVLLLGGLVAWKR